MTYQVKSWFGTAVPNVVSHPAVRSLAEKWFQITTERDPCLSDFWHNADDAFLDNAILLLKGEADYTYLHHGRALRQRIGFSMQGLRLTELRTRMRPTLMEIYDRCIDEFMLTYFQSFTDFEPEVTLWGRLALPVRLSSDDARPAIILYCRPIGDTASTFKASFENSRSGIVIASPVKNEAGDVVDAWIIAQNDQARHLTGVYDQTAPDLLLRRSRLFSRDDVWSMIINGVEQSGTLATFSDAVNGISINLYTELVDEYLVFRMTTVASVSRTFLLE